MTPNDYIDSLKIGVDVDWLKTNPGRTAYQKAKAKGKSVPKMFADRGFDHVRLRVKDYDIPLEEIAGVIDDCLLANIRPILAFQGQKYKEAPTPATRDELIEWWIKAALYLKDRSPELAYNLIIETTDALRSNPVELNVFYDLCCYGLSTVDPDRIKIICPCGISAPERLPDLKVPPECVVESHFYAAGPSKTTPSKLWIDGTPEEKQLILNKIELIKQWRSQANISVWVGAIMFADYNADDDNNLASSYTIEQQITFAKFVTGELKAASIPFAINSDTKYFDRDLNEWRSEQAPVLDAILGGLN